MLEMPVRLFIKVASFWAWLLTSFITVSFIVFWFSRTGGRGGSWESAFPTSCGVLGWLWCCSCADRTHFEEKGIRTSSWRNIYLQLGDLFLCHNQQRSWSQLLFLPFLPPPQPFDLFALYLKAFAVVYPSAWKALSLDSLLCGWRAWLPQASLKSHFLMRLNQTVLSILTPAPTLASGSLSAC